MTSLSSLAAFLGNNSFQVEASAAEAAVREKYPLLLEENEKILIAFKGRGGVGRDKSYFTTHRILIKDGKGIGSKRKNYQTVWYKHIKGFAIETAGSFDGDVELHVYASAGSSVKIDFAKGQVDIFAVQQFLNAKVDFDSDDSIDANVLPHASDHVDGTPVSTKSQGGFGQLVDWLGNNASQLDPSLVQAQLTIVTPVLLQGERVHLAFKAGRDTTVFTDKRLLLMDVQGILGKKIEFLTLKWSTISAFAVQTAGQYFDRDTEMKLYTNLTDRSVIQQDCRKSGADVMLIQKYLTNRVLIGGAIAAPGPLPTTVDRKAGHVDDAKGSWWFRDNQRPLDAVAMEEYYKTQVPILHSTEKVEYAFKGRRDITLFTTKRLIEIDPKGWAGVKVEYTSIPWTTMIAFGVKTAGKHLDTDAEVRFWTDMMFIPGNGEDPPEPGMSFLELDFNKNMVDVIVLKKYLSARLLPLNPSDFTVAAPIPPSTTMASAPDGSVLERFMTKIGKDNRAIDASVVNEQLRTTIPLLLDNESVVMAFKTVRDVIAFTNLRVLVMDVQGWSGKKVAYTSLPYRCIRAFSAESAGDWDRDSEIDLYTRNLWDMGKLQLDFRKGKADILQIQMFLTGMILGSPDDRNFYLTNTMSYKPETNTAGLGSFLSFLTDNAKQIDAHEVDARLHSDPPVLLKLEKVELAFRKARDMYVFTTHRLLIVDVQGLAGKKVEYLTIPWKWVQGFEIETAGHLDRDAEVYLRNAIAQLSRYEVSILVSTFDIYRMHQYMSRKLEFGTPEFVGSSNKRGDNYTVVAGNW